MNNPDMDTLVRWVLAALVIVVATGALIGFSPAAAGSLVAVTLAIAILGHHPRLRGPIGSLPRRHTRDARGPLHKDLGPMR